MVGIRFILVRIAQNEFFWFLLKPFVRFASFLLTEHNRKKDGQELRRQKDHYDTLLRNALRDTIVLRGPFKGLKYPSLEAAGSSLYPKLL